MATVGAKKNSRKRPLTESDTNAMPSAPAAKKVAKGKLASNAANCAAAPEPSPSVIAFRVPRGPNGEEFLPHILPRASAKHVNKIALPMSWSGNLDGSDDQSMTLGDAEWWASHEKWLNANKSKIGLTPALMSRQRTAVHKPDETHGKDDWDFICIPRLNWDIKEENDSSDDDEEDEDEEDDDEDDEDDEDDDEDEDGSPKPKHGHELLHQRASLHPEHVWIVSMLGYDRWQWWLQETLRRNQDEFDMYIYNDFSAYGAVEAVENLYKHLDKCFKDKNLTYQKLWPEVEGLAFFLASDFFGLAYMIDDGERMSELLALLAPLTMRALELLGKQNVLKPSSADGAVIPNISLILSILLRNIFKTWCDCDCLEENAGWILSYLAIMKKNGIVLSGLANFDKFLEEAEDAADQAGAEDDEKFDWKKDFAKYSKTHGPIGGTHYNLTTKSPARARGPAMFR